MASILSRPQCVKHPFAEIITTITVLFVLSVTHLLGAPLGLPVVVCHNGVLKAQKMNKRVLTGGCLTRIFHKWSLQISYHHYKVFECFNHSNGVKQIRCVFLYIFLSLDSFVSFPTNHRFGFSGICKCIIVPVAMMTSSNGDIFRVNGHLGGEFTGHRWISYTKASTRSFDWLIEHFYFVISDKACIVINT